MVRSRISSSKFLVIAAVFVLVGFRLVFPVRAWAGAGFPLPQERYDPVLEAWEGVWAFKNVNVITMVRGEKTRLKRQTVVVEDGFITEIGKAKRVEIPKGARVINGKKKYLIPGLIDSHTHLWQGDGRFADFDEKDLWTLFLANGITSVYELVGADPNNNIRPFLFDWRTAVNQGVVIGPEFFIASPRFRDDIQRNFPEIDAAVEQYADSGFDSIKVHAPNSLPNYLRLFEQAERHGIKPIGHPPYRSPDVSVDVVLEHQTMVAHTKLLMYQHTGDLRSISLSSEEKERMARDVFEAGTLVQPTEAIEEIHYLHLLNDYWADLIESEWLAYFPAALRQSWIENNDIRNGPNQNVSGTKLFVEAILKMTQELHKAGVPILAGSDSGGRDLTPHGFFFHQELDRLNRDVGLSTWETLEAATRNNARFIEREDLLGTIEFGKRADLVLLDRNPLKKIANLQKVAGVMVRGHWIRKRELNLALAELAERMSTLAAVKQGRDVRVERECDHGPAATPGIELAASPGSASSN